MTLYEWLVLRMQHYDFGDFAVVVDEARAAHLHVATDDGKLGEVRNVYRRLEVYNPENAAIPFKMRIDPFMAEVYYFNGEPWPEHVSAEKLRLLERR